MTIASTLIAAPDPEPGAWNQIVAGLAAKHPLWCHNRGKIDGCRDVDEEFQILHTRDTVRIPVRDLYQQSLGLDVSLFRAVRNHGPLKTGVEINLPGGHADLDRDQVRLLIAELSHLDNLWDL
jgi:hypothetical protein